MEMHATYKQKKLHFTKQLSHAQEIKQHMLTIDPKITTKNKVILMTHVLYLNKHACYMQHFLTHNSLPRDKEVGNTLWKTSFHI